MNKPLATSRLRVNVPTETGLLEGTSSESVRNEYEAALRRVMGLPDFERSSHSPGHATFHLERMSLLLDRLGSPHLDIPTVHIAGTNGKGSTAAMVASILTAQGYKTGLYTSPHLHSAVERIRVDLDPIRRQHFSALVHQVWPTAEWIAEHGGHGPLTFFELVTAMAFVHFKQQGADFQVIEVGLGGRLDATNLVRPEVCTITPISLDHVATLGSTVSLIAREKAGIIKCGVPVVAAPQPAEARRVLRDVAAERDAPLLEVAERVTWSETQSDLHGQSFDVVAPRKRYHVRTPLLGDHQVENAATAIATVETLIDRGFDISPGSVVEGIRRVRWPGRLQVLSRDGRQVVVDGAHNPDGVRVLVRALRQYFRFNRSILIFGGLSGHSAREMLVELSTLAPEIIAVRPRHPRSAPSEVIADGARELGLLVRSRSEDVGLATRQAIDMAGPEDLVLGTGSLSVAAEVIEEIDGVEPELYPYLKGPTYSPSLT